MAGQQSAGLSPDFGTNPASNRLRKALRRPGRAFATMGIFESLRFGWIDVLVLIALLVGFTRGRKRGMSVELLDVLKWLLVVVVAGHAYGPLGEMLAQTTPFNNLFCYVAVYLVIILAFVGLFSWIRPRLGDKLVSADVFGTGEYYLGMVAGAFRYACIILVLLALMNARQYTQQEIQSQNAFQETNFGSIRFPTLISFQSAVFERSFTGSMARNYLSTYLIRPTVPEEKGLSRNGVARARERMVNDVLDKH
jgi:uncharacterized membrane protein required for colicin V production